MDQGQTGSGSIVANFSRQADARKALEALRNAGFSVSERGTGPLSSHEPGRDTASGRDLSTTAGAKSGVWEKVKATLATGPEAFGEQRTEGKLGTTERTGESTGSSFHPDANASKSEDLDGGATTLTVSAGGRVAEVQDILRRYGGQVE